MFNFKFRKLKNRVVYKYDNKKFHTKLLKNQREKYFITFPLIEHL